MNLQPCNSHRQFESPRPGAAGIDEQDVVTRHDARFVRVTADDGANSRYVGFAVKFVDVVDHVNLSAINLEIEYVRQLLRPRSTIIVTANGVDRRDRVLTIAALQLCRYRRHE